MKLIVCALALVALTQASDDVDWSKVMPRHILPELPEEYYKLPSQKIVGGYEAVPNSIPYQVGLLITATGGTFFCGGSLISRRYVLTAAHCVDGGFSVQVRLGAHRINDNEATQVRVTSTSITIHPGWNAASLVNDIALIWLPSDVQLNDNIQLINLPSRNDANNDFAGVNARISGWGRDSDQATGISPVLRFVFADVITNSLCYSSYGSYITNGHICTNGNGGIGSCSGDSGGPLVIDGKQVGIVSFGISLGCEVNWPSAFTRVTYYLDWIAQNSDVVIN